MESSISVQSPDQQSQPNSESLLLPNEILYKILSYVQCPKDLLNWRSLSTSWYEITSFYLNQNQVPVKFFKPYDDDYPVNDNIEQFLETMKNRTQGTFPFSCFEFYLTQYQVLLCLDTLDKFCHKIGPLVKNYAIHLEHFFEGDLNPVLTSLVAHSPKLEMVRIYGQESSANSSVSLDHLSLRTLKYLIIMPYSPDIGWICTDSDHDGTGQVTSAQMSSWISCSKPLRIVKTGFGVKTSSKPEAKAFLKLLKPFHVVELELKTDDTFLLQALAAAPLKNLRSLYLDFRDDTQLVYNCLQALSPSLKQLNMKLHCVYNNKIPNLTNLESLELELVEEDGEFDLHEYLEEPLSSAKFPVLKSLILKDYFGCLFHKYDVWPLFDGNKFDSVEYFDVSECSETQLETWPGIFFPNAKTDRGSIPVLDYTGTTHSTTIFSMRQLTYGTMYVSKDDTDFKDRDVLHPAYSTLKLS